MDATRTLLEALERDMLEDQVVIQYLDHEEKLQTWSGCGGDPLERISIEGLHPYVVIRREPAQWRDSSDPIWIPLSAVISIRLDRHTGSDEDPLPSVACWLRFGEELQRFTRELPHPNPVS